ncbi:hypothetical protein ACVU7I_08785 [Patulibacter sp. S7RM1-6]
MPLAFTVTGAPALLIILVVLALLVTGAVVAVRAAGRGVRKGVDHVGHRDADPDRVV